MKPIFFIIVISLSIGVVEAQNDSVMAYKISYERKITPKNFTKSFFACLELKSYPDLNISVFDSCEPENSNENTITKDPDDDMSFSYTPKGKNIRVVFKDYHKNELFNKGEIADKYFTIKDSLNIFNWEIKGDTKEILGYTCQLATMVFRGREYTAWFSPDLPLGGPWKYDGLPGMILSIKSNDPFIEFEATAILTHKMTVKTIENPFKNDTQISWSEYKNIYKKKAIELSNYNSEKGFSSGGIIVERMGIERYIEEDDTDYVADKEFEKQLSQKKN